MKKTYSFSLEEDIVNEIKKYEKEIPLGSTSAALERIILEFFRMKDMKSNLRDVLMEFVNTEQTLNINKVEEKKEKVEEDDSDFMQGIQSCFANIPDD